jgi:hypothetical protein
LEKWLALGLIWREGRSREKGRKEWGIWGGKREREKKECDLRAYFYHKLVFGLKSWE